MEWLRIALSRCRSLFIASRLDDELDEEVRAHIDLAIQDNLKRGLSEREAKRLALRDFGGVTQVKELYRFHRGLPIMERAIQDFRFAVRQLFKSPAFALTAIFTIALGIGASVTIFSFVDASLLRPFSYRDSSRLVGVFEATGSDSESNVSYLDYLDWKKLNKAFDTLAVHNDVTFTLRSGEGGEHVGGARVSSDFFHTLGVNPVLGRDFRPGEDLPSAARTAILSYGTWQNRFGGNEDVLGKQVTLDEVPYTIIGVMPRDFHFAPAEPAEFWVPLNVLGPCEIRRSCHNLRGLGRLKDGVSLAAALADVKSIAWQLEQQYPDSNRGQSANVVSLYDVIVGKIRPTLIALMIGALLLLVISCVNVSSLLLVRSERRKREFAVRSALGASKGRLISQLAIESVVLVAVGAAVGLGISFGAARLLIILMPKALKESMPSLLEVGMSPRVFGFVLAISLLGCLLFMLTPSFRLTESRMIEGLTEGGRGYAGSVWRKFGANLVAVELAVAVVLLVGAGLLGKSLYRLLRVDTGLQPEHLATLMVSAPASAYAGDEQAMQLGKRVVNQVAALPGVVSVGISNALPMSWLSTTWINIEGRPSNGEHNEVIQRDVSADYFKTLQARLVRGRYFTDTEDATKPQVAIINRTFAEVYFPGANPLGAKLSFVSLTRPPMEIVGIIEDIKEGPIDATTRPAFYIPFNQSPYRDFAVVVRTSQSEGSLFPTITNSIHQIDSNIAVYAETSMLDKIHDSPSTYVRRSLAALVGAFASVALLMSVIGLYGVIAYSVSQRTREIGVRMALGAQRRTVYALILKEAGWLVSMGIVSGLICSVAAAMVMRKLLFGIRSWDAPTLAAVTGILAASALIATYVPARRAASINPVEALRSE